MHPIRILIVEDNDVTVELLKRILSKNGFEVVASVSTSNDALEMMKKSHIDIVLMDVSLNDEASGIETANLINRLYNIPSVFLTSHSDTHTLYKAMELGAFRFVIKPFDETELLIAIRMVLYKSQTDEKSNLSFEDDINNNLFHDLLTNAYNRKGMFEMFEKLNNSKYLPLGVFTVDINGLAGINNANGTNIGDMLLIKMAELLNKYCGKQSVISRVGEDSFLCLIPNKTMENLEIMQSHIIEMTSKEIEVDFLWSFSCGYAVKSTKEQALVDVVQIAEDSMNWDKLIQPNSNRGSIIGSALLSFVGKTNETKEHCLRLSVYSIFLGRALGLPHSDIVKLEVLSNLHDIGKIGIPENILEKDSKLNPKEREIMQSHSIIGHKIVKASTEFSGIADEVLHIHERWDGNGFPDKLAKEDIPLFSRIVAIADAYDAMTNDRVYRKAMSKKAALRELEENAGIQFDPELVKTFLRIMQENDV